MTDTSQPPERADTEARINTALDQLRAALAPLQSDRAQLLQAFLEDPKGKAEQLRQCEARIAAMQTDISRMEDARKVFDTEAEARAKAQRVQDHTRNITAVGLISASREKLAKDVDDAFQATLDALQRYVDNGKLTQEHPRRRAVLVNEQGRRLDATGRYI